MIGGSTRIPLVRDFVSRYFNGRALRTDVSPDEAVSLGAAVLAGIEKGSFGDAGVIITDVAPHTFGVATAMDVDGEIVDDLFSPLIKRQSTIPRTVRESFSTMYDWQKRVHVRVFQGEGEFCHENEPVGDFHHELTPSPAGSPIEIEMSYNLDGLVVVVARDPKSGKESKLRIAPDARRLSDDQKVAAKQRLDRRWSREATPPATGRTSVTGESAETKSAEDASQSKDQGPDWRAHPLFLPIEALVTHAERRLPILEATNRDKVRDLLRELKAAVLGGQSRDVDRLEKRLTDLLFDLE
jgi:molecular chaperone DnaK (HSP70)